MSSDKTSDRSFLRDLYLLKLYYSLFLRLVETFIGGYIISTSTDTDEKYQLLCIEIEKILENSQLDILRNANWQPFENLLSVDDIDWEYGGSQRCYDFQGQIDKEYIRNGKKEFELEPAELSILNQMDIFLNKLEKEKQLLDASVVKVLKESVGSLKDKFIDLNKKTIPKTEDQSNEFKEFYQYDTGMEELSDSLKANKRSGFINNLKHHVQEKFAAAMCSFGNDYGGGFVYLGIRSDGTIVGLEKDMQIGGFADYSDVFSNHIRNRLEVLLKDKAFIAGKLQIKFRNINDKTICITQVLPSDQPLFLYTKLEKLFYVRGPTPRAEKLSGIDQSRYIKDRFPDFK